MEVTLNKTTFEFKAEIKQLLNILVHSLYTNKEIFLRELISNASDASDKLRFNQIKGMEIENSNLELEIKISADKKKNILRIRDFGIGMTVDEIIENIGTIAKSGTGEFLKILSESKENVSNLIGKFGVGFYSVFMVAEKVIVKSKSYKIGEKAVIWESDGLGSYTLSEMEDNFERGTEVEIFLKEEEKDFTEDYRLENIIKTHSNFISFPIKLGEKQINTVSALWREPKSSIKKEQYDEFFKSFTYDSEPPMEVIHTSVDAPIQFTSLLFIPKKNFDFFGYNRDNYGLDLYVRRVLIQHQNKELLPEYLSFVKGIVESEDIPLNISRETLQQNIIFNKISSSVTTTVLSHLMKMAKDRAEEYEVFWKEHGRVFTLGYGDYANQEKWLDLYRFNSSFNENEKQLTSFERYVARMKEGQKEIYYIFGQSREAVETAAQTEIFKKKGIEIIYLFDPLDEFAINSVRKYKEFEIKSVDQADLSKLEKFTDEKLDDKKTEELSKDEKLQLSSLFEKMKEILGDKVTAVKESKRLSDSPVVLLNPDDSISATMQKIMQISQNDKSIPKRIMEVNPDHILVRNLLKVYKANNNDPYISDVTNQLYQGALLLEGYLHDPHQLVKNINKMLEKSSSWYTQINSL